jgi:benzoylformate decarboxylase
LLNALLPVRAPLGRLSAAGGGLGFAMPAAVGLRLALPERPVICVIGDWSSLYSVHALWSAAHYHAGVLFVALRNGGYRILDHLSAEAAPGATPAWPAIEPLDIATIAEGFGCPSARATTTGELLDHLNRVVPTLRTAATPLLLQVDVPDEPSDRP